MFVIITRFTELRKSNQYRPIRGGSKMPRNHPEVNRFTLDHMERELEKIRAANYPLIPPGVFRFLSDFLFFMGFGAIVYLKS